MFGPSENYELTAHVPFVLFPRRLVHDPSCDELRLYDGAADICIVVATSTLTAVLTYLSTCDPG